MILRNNLVFLKLLYPVQIFNLIATFDLKRSMFFKSLVSYKTYNSQGIEHSSGNFILTLHMRHILFTMPRNIPAKPMITSVVTLKSCGFFMSAVKGLA
jgi:hypothetical protein